MAFVTIRRGTTQARVSKNMFDTYYKNLGYRIVDGDNDAHFSKNKNDEKAVTSEEAGKQEPEIDSIPISEMNKEQLIEYAEWNDIKIPENGSVKDIRRAIQKHIQESKM